MVQWGDGDSGCVGPLTVGILGVGIGAGMKNERGKLSFAPIVKQDRVSIVVSHLRKLCLVVG
jgi:hypothetical protein